MNVGVDIDGVITNLDFIRQNKNNKTVLDTKPSVTYKNNELIRSLLFVGIKIYSKHAIIRPHASKVINDIKNEGHKIIIITKREFSTEDSKKGATIRALVELYLLERNIPYDKILYVDDDKVKACIDESIDVMIEDDGDITEKISEYKHVFLFNAPYNRYLEKDNVTRVYNWDEIGDLLLKPKKGKVLSL